MKYLKFLQERIPTILCLVFLTLGACNDKKDDTGTSEECPTLPCPCNNDFFAFVEETDCTDQVYPNPLRSPYVIPFPANTQFSTGLTNCSTNFHSGGNPEQHAYDFDLPEGTKFIAARAGEVVKVVEDKEDGVDSVGNYVVIDHIDNSFAIYYHSPKDGIDVEEGDKIEQGDVLGAIGKSGMAEYPHLQFIVVKDDYTYPYSGLAISFNNVKPLVTILKSYTSYSVCP